MATMQRIRDVLRIGKPSQNCHGEGLNIDENGLKKVGIVGTPNVGKSVIFNCLTGAYVTVSNYPGTTVDVSRGKAKIQGEEFEVMDTPGMYSLMPITEEERVARTMLLAEKPDVILHVVDARNLDRMLPLTIQLIEAGLPVMLDLNMIDEAEAAGLGINIITLEQELGIPVVATVATTGRGVETLKRRLAEYVRNQNCADV
jgi:ferrous iron transport protein B